MKICQVNNYTAPAKNAQGAQRVLESLTRSLTRFGHEVSLLINSDSKTDLGLVVNNIPKDTDIVHYHGGFPEEYGHNNNFKWVTTSHGGGSDTQERMNELRRFVHNILFVSHFCSNMYNSNCVVHSSVPVEDFPFQKKKDNYFLWLAGTDWGEQKGLFSSIEIAKKMGLRLKIAGGGKNDAIIQQVKSQTTQKIEFLGFVNGQKKVELLSNAKALLMIGKIADACPLTSIEAMACGTPIIARNTASHPEIIGEDAGMLCDTDSDICKAIVRIGKVSTEKCRDRYLQNFTSEISTKKHIEFYKYVIKHGSLKGWQ